MGLADLKDTMLCDVLKSLESRLREYYVSVLQDTLQNLEPFKIVERPFSIVLFLRGDRSSGARRFVAKKVLHHPANSSITREKNQAIVEYGGLKKLHAIFQQVPRCSVLQPILVVPEQETYVMSYVEDRLLRDEFRYSRVLSLKDKFRRLTEQLFNWGLWLKRFQFLTGFRQADAKALYGVLERAEHGFQLIEGTNDPRCPKDLRYGVTKLLYEQVGKLSGAAVLVAGRHGDFMPLNIISSAEGVTVIDFLGYQEDPVPVDSLKMLVYLVDESKCLTNSGKRVKEVKEAFIDGYGGIPAIPAPVSLLFEAMQRIVSVWGMISNKAKWLHHRIEADLWIREHVRWLLDDKYRHSLFDCYINSN